MLINCVCLPQMNHFKGQNMKHKSLYIGTKEWGVIVSCGSIWLNTDGVLSWWNQHRLCSSLKQSLVVWFKTEDFFTGGSKLPTWREKFVSPCSIMYRWISSTYILFWSQINIQIHLVPCICCMSSLQGLDATLGGAWWSCISCGIWGAHPGPREEDFRNPFLLFQRWAAVLPDQEVWLGWLNQDSSSITQKNEVKILKTVVLK